MNILSKTKKKTYSIIALFLTLSIIIPIAVLPTTGAHDPPQTVKVWVYAATSSNPIGVGQQTLITFWCNMIMPTANTDSRYGDRWIFYVDITSPSGVNQTLGPFTSDPVGGTFTTFSPTEEGNYTIVARMPAFKLTGLPSATGVPINNEYVNDTFGPAASEPVTLVAQQEQIEPWKETPLPEEYWTRPIYSANRFWNVLAANWLSGAANQIYPNTKFAYGKGPESPHILWSRPYYAGGIMDERYGTTGYQTMHYGGISLSNMMVLEGKIIVSNRNTAHTNNGWWVIDLYTGKTIALYNNTVMPSFASIYNYESPNQHGGFPYLWRTSGVTLPANYTTGSGLQTWELLSGYTFDTITTIANVSASGTAVYGKDGSILRYNIVTSGGVQYLTCWNSSAIPSELLGTTGTNSWQWRPQRLAVHDGNTGFSLNVSLNGQNGKSLPVQGSIRWVREGKDIVGGTVGSNDGKTVVQGNLWTLNLDPAKGPIGSLIGNITFTPPVASSNLTYAGNRPGMMFGSISVDDGVFIFRQDLTRQYWGFSLETGQQLWEGKPESQMQYYGLSSADCTGIYQGKFLSYGYGGEVTAYNITTGEVVWKYAAVNQGFESPYGNYPVGVACVADGKLYLTTSEHSPTQPLFRGSDLRCINATDGTEIWKILHWSAGMAAGTGVYIADGRLLSLNSYDNQIYCYGKGPSATTISAPNTVQPLNTPVLIQGVVTDTAPGGNQGEQAARFPNGVPAVSDESMQTWMEYVYMQQQKPTDTKGVEVIVSVLDPNSNFYEVGRTTSDSDGMYKLMFTPEVPGAYTVIATFAGTNSYYGSHAQTALGITEISPSATPEATPIALSAADLYFVPAVIGIIIANIVIGLAIVILLRKRP